VCLAYIAVSGRIAARFAASVGELESIERIKGFAFVIVTSLLLFVLAWRGLRRIAVQENEIEKEREALADVDRRALSGLFAASVAHDMNNMLTTAMGGLERLKVARGLDPPEREAVTRTSRALDGLARLARRLVSVGRERRPGHLADTDLSAVLESSAEFARSHPKIRTVRLTTRVARDLQVKVNEETVQQALLNLMLNAADAAGAGGRVEIRGHRAHSGIAVEVHDNGPGVPAAIRSAIFEPFYTTKPDGTGLGLLSVKECAAEHGGSFDVDSSDLGGACFRIVFPEEP
jgi:signal transduction histidine kinase